MKNRVTASSFSELSSIRDGFSGRLALGLCTATPGARNPVDAVIRRARRLVLASGLKHPPYHPALYAPLRSISNITEKRMEIDGRLVPIGNQFTIELRRDRSPGRKNFTCAHEIAHTFFYESVPAIKYRSIGNIGSTYDHEEEMLCNIAAAELIMPSKPFAAISTDFQASPQSLLEIAALFEASLTATAVRLLSLGIWKSKFVLWERTDNNPRALWLARPKGALVYFPSISIKEPQTSGICRALSRGESSTTEEWLNLDAQDVYYRTDSIRLSPKHVLSSIIVTGAEGRVKRLLPPVPLSFEYECECDGSGWRLIKSNGYTQARRCRAVRHQMIATENLRAR